MTTSCPPVQSYYLLRQREFPEATGTGAFADTLAAGVERRAEAGPQEVVGVNLEDPDAAVIRATGWEGGQGRVGEAMVVWAPKAGTREVRVGMVVAMEAGRAAEAEGEAGEDQAGWGRRGTRVETEAGKVAERVGRGKEEVGAGSAETVASVAGRVGREGVTEEGGSTVLGGSRGCTQSRCPGRHRCLHRG